MRNQILIGFAVFIIIVGLSLFTSSPKDKLNQELLDARTESIHEIFNGNAQVYDSSGQDITNDFISKYQEDYNKGDLLTISIAMGEKELSLIQFSK